MSLSKHMPTSDLINILVLNMTVRDIQVFFFRTVYIFTVHIFQTRCCGIGKDKLLGKIGWHRFKDEWYAGFISNIDDKRKISVYFTDAETHDYSWSTMKENLKKKYAVWMTEKYQR